jgi:hypothetical protein
MSESSPRAGNRWARAVPWTACLVALGLGLRCYHYLRDPSMWHDEAALALNVLDKDFPRLLGPLAFAEAAPPLFLWVEKAATLLLGDGTYALRLAPFLASCAALLLLAGVARRLLPAPAVPWAVLLFACSDNLLWHACEAKPYAGDVFCAAALLAVYAGTHGWPLARRLGVFCLLAPVLIVLSYPGCFLCGGLLVALLPEVARARRGTAWLGYGLLALVVAGAFTALFLGPVRAQRCEEMARCWVDHFPPWDRPWKVPLWAAASVCEVGRYCCRPTGQVLTAAAVLGTYLLWRRQRALAALLTVPTGLALVASCLHAYPFGGTRVLVYSAPAFVLLVAEGAAVLGEWCRSRARLAPVALAAVLLTPAALTAYRVVCPWERADCAGASAYVLARRRPADPVTANHWEYLYYFRHLGPNLTPLTPVPPPPGARLWLVLSGGTPPERLWIAGRLAPGDWQPLERREFTRTTVFLLRRPGP